MSSSLSLSLAGDITQKGYEKKRSKLIGAFFPQGPGKTDLPSPFNSDLFMNGTSADIVSSQQLLETF